MLVSEIWSAAKGSAGYGKCDDATLYRAITEAVAILSDKGKWDWMIGHMTLCAFDGYIVLPREVEKIEAANIDGFPTWRRDKWYIHHINGVGEYSGIDGYRSFFDEVGETSTFRCVPKGSLLVALPELDSDDGKEMIVQGYDWFDKELFHIDPTTGTQVKGIRVPISIQTPYPYIDPRVVKKVDNILKPQTEGMVALWAFPECYDENSEPTMLGNYYPDEVNPRYRKYRFPSESCLNIKYRRKNLLYQSQNDFIPFDSSVALKLMLKAVRYYDEGQVSLGEPLEDKAIRILKSAASAKQAGSDVGPQFKDFSTNNDERLRSGMDGYRGRSCCC